MCLDVFNKCLQMKWKKYQYILWGAWSEKTHVFFRPEKYLEPEISRPEKSFRKNMRKKTDDDLDLNEEFLDSTISSCCKMIFTLLYVFILQFGKYELKYVNSIIFFFWNEYYKDKGLFWTLYAVKAWLRQLVESRIY